MPDFGQPVQADEPPRGDDDDALMPTWDDVVEIG